MSGRSRDSAYWLARLEREHPAIAQRLHAREIPSVRAAAIEAGLLREPSPLIELRRAWRKASPEDRTAFITEVALSGVSGAAQPGRDGRRHAELPQPAEEADLFALPPKASRSPRRAQPSPAKPAVAPEPPRVQETRPPLPVPTPPRPFPPALNPASSHGSLDHPGNGHAGSAVFGGGASGHGSLPPSPPANGESKPLSRVRRLFGLASARDDMGGSGGEPSRHGVAVGQRYVKIDAGPGAWQVLSVFAGPLNVPHVRIASVDEPDIVRVVSLAALTDRSRYQPLP